MSLTIAILLFLVGGMCSVTAGVYLVAGAGAACIAGGLFSIVFSALVSRGLTDDG